MAGREIKTTLAIDGEQKYKRALDEAKGSLRNLGTQLTLATAEFKKDGDAMRLVEARSKALKQEIEQQEAIVKSLEGAVEDATEAYGENSRQADKWQADLNRARATLANLQTELQYNEQGLDKNGRAFSQASQAAGQFGRDVQSAARTANAASFLSLDTSLKNISNTLTGVFDGIVKLGTAGWNLLDSSAQRADELITRAKRFGMDTDTLQQWELASKIIDTDSESMVKAMDKLLNPSDALVKAMRGLHVARYELQDTGGGILEAVPRSTLEVFWDTIEALGAMGDAETKNAVANELFGKSYRDLLPLIEAGREGWKEAGEGALITSQENLEKLAAFNDKVETLEQNWEAMKGTLAASLVEPLGKVADTFGELVRKFDEWANSEAGQEALSKLGGAISDVFTAFTDNVDFSAIVDTVTGAIQGFTGALDWVSEHSGEVVGGLQALFYALLALKGIEFGNSIVNMVGGLKNLLGSGAAAGGGGLLAGIGAALGSAAKFGVSKVLPVAGGLTLGLSIGNAIEGRGFTPIAQTSGDELFDQNGNVTEMGRKMGITASNIDQALAMGQPTTWNDIYDLQNAKKAAQAQREAEMEAAWDAQQNLDNWIAGLKTSEISDIGELSDEAMAALAQRIFDLGLSSGFAHDFESLDDLYRALKNEGNQTDEAGAVPGSLRYKKLFEDFPGVILPEQTMTEEERLMALFGLSDLSAGSISALKDRMTEQAKQVVADAWHENGEQLMYQDAHARIMEGLGGTLQDYEAVIHMLTLMDQAPPNVPVAPSVYDQMYNALEKYEPDTDPRDTNMMFDEVFWPLIQQAARSAGLDEDAAGAMADQFWDMWIDSLFNDSGMGSADIVKAMEQNIQELLNPAMDQAGQDAAQGLADGIDAGAPVAVAAMGRLAAAVMEGVGSAMSGALAAMSAAAVATAPRVAASGGSAAAARTYNSTRTNNFGIVNINNSMELEALMDAMDDRSQYARRARGA